MYSFLERGIVGRVQLAFYKTSEFPPAANPLSDFPVT